MNTKRVPIYFKAGKFVEKRGTRTSDTYEIPIPHILREECAVFKNFQYFDWQTREGVLFGLPTNTETASTVKIRETTSHRKSPTKVYSSIRALVEVLAVDVRNHTVDHTHDCAEWQWTSHEFRVILKKNTSAKPIKT